MGPALQQDLAAARRRRDRGVPVERLGYPPAHDAGCALDQGEERGDRRMGEHLLEDARGVKVRRLELPGPHDLSTLSWQIFLTASTDTSALLETRRSGVVHMTKVSV